MDEQELWTPADDETIRRALDSLSWESDALPLADAWFVKARGNSRRRRALAVGAAAAAAAVAIVGVLGFNALGRNQALDLPGSQIPASWGLRMQQAQTSRVCREARGSFAGQVIAQAQQVCVVPVVLDLLISVQCRAHASLVANRLDDIRG